MPAQPYRKTIAVAELKSIAAQAGYENDIPGFLDACEDMGLGLQQSCQARRNGTIDEWGYVAHLKNYTLALGSLLQGAKCK